MREEKKITRGAKGPIREVSIEEAGDHLHFTVNLGGSNWSSVIGIDDGHVFCDCPDFFYKKGLRDNIDISDIQHQCKHIKAAIAELMNHGVLTVEDLKRRKK